MTQITLRGNPINTEGSLPKVGTTPPPFTLIAKDLSEVHLDKYKGKKVLLNIFPSLDTNTCSLSIQKFNKLLSEHPEIVVLNISKDTPFAADRFCSSHSLPGATFLSAINSTFGTDYGVQIKDGPIKGFLSRAVIIVDTNGKIIYEEQVSEVSHEPNYEKAAQALGLNTEAIR